MFASIPGTGGIGRAIASQFAASGYSVTVISRSSEKATLTAAGLSLHSKSQRHRGMKCDVTDSTEVTEVFGQLMSIYNANKYITRIVLVNAAGIAVDGLLPLTRFVFAFTTTTNILLAYHG